jgi:PAS domain S-box-containing protein
MGESTKHIEALVSENKSLKRRVQELEKLKDERICDQKSLMESEVRYRSVFENTGTATIIIEKDMTISMVNAKFETLTGHSKDEIQGKMKWTDFVVPDDIERMKQYHYKRREDRQSAPTEYECKVFSRDGEIRDMFVKIDMIEGSKDSVASFMDITTFKQTEAALIESERKLSKLMGNLPGMAFRCMPDEYRTMNFISAGCKWLTGYTPFELIDNKKKSFMDLIHPEDRSSVSLHIQESISKGQPYQLEYRIFSASGQTKWVWEEGVGIAAEKDAVPEVEGFISDITDHKLEEQQLRKENIRLKTSIRERFKFGDIIGKNRSMQEVYERITKAAVSNATVIIYGESGTGKELVALEIHRLSDNHDYPFIPVNCSAIPENLFESEFFGYKKGAFTGALADKPGYFDLAEGGTLFLDEVGDIGLAAQAKLLRVLEGAGYTPVGGQDMKKADARIVAATNRDLKEQVKSGRMREDFFYRIHVIPITLPPLRERKDDLPLLIEHFLSMYAKDEPSPKIDGKVLGYLYNYNWPGNIRELQNVLQRYITLKTLDFMGSSSPESRLLDDIITPDDALPKGESLETILERIEKEIILKTLEKNQWQKNKTATALKIDRKTLFRKLKKYMPE